MKAAHALNQRLITVHAELTVDAVALLVEVCELPVEDGLGATPEETLAALELGVVAAAAVGDEEDKEEGTEEEEDEADNEEAVEVDDECEAEAADDDDEVVEEDEEEEEEEGDRGAVCVTPFITSRVAERAGTV
jgi:hypothetical protein